MTEQPTNPEDHVTRYHRKFDMIGNAFPAAQPELEALSELVAFLISDAVADAEDELLADLGMTWDDVPPAAAHRRGIV